MSKSKSRKHIIFSKPMAIIFLLLASSLSFYAQERYNNRPLKDFAAQVSNAVAEKRVDLNEPFSIEVAGNLSEDGKLIDAKVKNVSGKSEIVEIAKNSVTSLSDSGYFKYLRDIGAKEVLLQISQDEKELAGIIKSDIESEAKAKQIKSSLNLLISIKKQQSKDEEEKFFLNNFNIASEGKTLQLIFRAPREEVQELIKRKLEKAKSENANE